MVSVSDTYLVYCACVLLFALLLDSVVGEVKCYHPLVGFGRVASKLERWLNISPGNNPFRGSYIRGALAWGLMVLPLPLVLYFVYEVWALQWPILLRLGLDVLIVYFALGLQSLKQHGFQVYKPLSCGDLDLARHFTGYLVSRETSKLSAQDMSRATVESMLENGHDAVIATLFWFVVGGAPAVILHRLVNTLDAMWGYKNTRFRAFGWFAARSDDLLGFFPAKVCALLYACQGGFFEAIKNAFRQGSIYKSHNGGWVMAAGATSMNIKLGGPAVYHGELVLSPVLGRGNWVSCDDIPRSLLWVRRATFLFIGVVFLAGIITLWLSRFLGGV